MYSTKVFGFIILIVNSIDCFLYNFKIHDFFLKYILNAPIIILVRSDYKGNGANPLRPTGITLTPSCAITCTGVWSNSAPVKHTEFYSFTNRTEQEVTNTFNWVWPGLNSLGVWDVLYKEEQMSGLKTGRIVFVNEKNITLYINWIYSEGKLSWTSTYEQVPEETWNLTLCFKNNNILFEGTSAKWIFTIGNVSIDSSAGSTGSIDVGQDFLSFQPTMRLMGRLKRSPQSETEDEDEAKKATVWNRLKGYFRELFDRGPNDQRGWLTRVADWILGFLERLLT